MLIKKCKSTSGASLFIALLFFLMCGLAGSVIITAASTSAGSLLYLKKDEQSYYTVLSAARLLKKEIQGEKYSRCQIISENKQEVLDYYNELPQKAIKDFLKKAADTIFESGSYSDIWTIESSESVIQSVTANFVMDNQYNITIICTQGNKSCTLKIPAVVSKEKFEGAETTTIIWTEGKIQK